MKREHQRFSEIIGKHLSGEELSADEKTELATIARSEDFVMEQEEVIFNGHVKLTDCYWICRGSNWSCNPQSPPPGCDCYKVCI